MSEQDRIKAEFRAALAAIQLALRTGERVELRTARLNRQRQLGKLRLTLSSIAAQAGRSRGLIASDDAESPYADVRAEILAAIGPRQKGKTQRETIDELRASVAVLKQKVRARDSRNLELLARMEKERIAAKLGLQAAGRLAARPAADAADRDDLLEDDDVDGTVQV